VKTSTTHIFTRLAAAGALLAGGAGALAATPAPASGDGSAPDRANAAARVQAVRVDMKAGTSGTDGIQLSVGLAPDDGNPATCGNADTLQIVIGDAVNYCYTVTNTSGTVLAFHTLTDSVDGTIFSLMPHTLADGESFQFNRTAVVQADSGVHEATWTAQDQPPGYVAQPGQYGFIDISQGNGTALDPFDDGSAEVVLPFDLPFYDGSSNTLWVGNNGGIVVGDVQQSIPSFEFPLPYVNPIGPIKGSLILPYWDDLSAGAGNVYWLAIGDTPPRHAVIQWNRPHFLGDDDALASFEVWLGEDGTISFQYQNTAFGDPDNPDWDNGGSATIGLQNADGSIGNQYSYDTASLTPPQAIDWIVTHPQFASASASTTIEPLQPATLAVNPDPLSASADLGSTAVEVPLVIANAGQVDLHWSVTEAAGGTSATASTGASGPSVASTADAHGRASSYRQAVQNAVPIRASETAGCDAGTPGIQIQDDGIPDDGYTEVSFDVVYERVAYVQPFAPQTYPALVSSVCVAFVSNGPTTQDFEVLVYDDTGPAGTPGNLIASVPATATGIPANGASFVRVDLGGYAISIANGNAYIGVAFDPRDPGSVFMAADTSGAPNPEGYQGHALVWPGPMLSWSQLIDPGVGHPDFHSLLVRPVLEPDYCADMADVPWLSLSVGGGVVSPQSQQTITATLDPSGLAAGTYSATLCIASSDPRNRRLPVHVAFNVGDRIFPDGFEGD
jgi:hypothetical protein